MWGQKKIYCGGFGKNGTIFFQQCRFETQKGRSRSHALWSYSDAVTVVAIPTVVAIGTIRAVMKILFFFQFREKTAFS